MPSLHQYYLHLLACMLRSAEPCLILIHAPPCSVPFPLLITAASRDTETHGTRFEPSAWNPSEISQFPKSQPAARTGSTLYPMGPHSFRVAFLAEPSVRGKRALISTSPLPTFFHLPFSISHLTQVSQAPIMRHSEWNQFSLRQGPHNQAV